MSIILASDTLHQAFCLTLFNRVKIKSEPQDVNPAKLSVASSKSWVGDCLRSVPSSLCTEAFEPALHDCDVHCASV